MLMGQRVKTKVIYRYVLGENSRMSCLDYVCSSGDYVYVSLLHFQLTYIIFAHILYFLIYLFCSLLFCLLFFWVHVSKDTKYNRMVSC